MAGLDKSSPGPLRTGHCRWLWLGILNSFPNLPFVTAHKSTTRKRGSLPSVALSYDRACRPCTATFDWPRQSHQGVLMIITVCHGRSLISSGAEKESRFAPTRAVSQSEEIGGSGAFANRRTAEEGELHKLKRLTSQTPAFFRLPSQASSTSF